MYYLAFCMFLMVYKRICSIPVLFTLLLLCHTATCPCGSSWKMCHWWLSDLVDLIVTKLSVIQLNQFFTFRCFEVLISGRRHFCKAWIHFKLVKLLSNRCTCVEFGSQVLDFERESEYILVLSAQNPVALVRGRYGPASTATVSIYVDDVNEGPILSQSHYEVTVREGEEPGRVIATIRGYDPDSHPIRWAGRTAVAKPAQFNGSDLTSPFTQVLSAGGYKEVFLNREIFWRAKNCASLGQRGEQHLHHGGHCSGWTYVLLRRKTLSK